MRCMIEQVTKLVYLNGKNAAEGEDEISIVRVTL